MPWKKELQQLEATKQWDAAIALMQAVIHAHPNDMPAYIDLNFLLMNLLAVENYDDNKFEYYKTLCKRYFAESYAKFANNAEYLFCTGVTAAMSEWFFGIPINSYEQMLQRAMELEPNNLLYRRTYFLHLDPKSPTQKQAVIDYARLILRPDSPLIKEWEQRGALGAYLRQCMTGWAQRTLIAN